MGFALPRCEAPDRDTLNSNNGSPDRAAEEARLVSTAYYAWPIAVFEQIAPREGASSWYRFHMRQAFWFGGIAAVAGTLALLWPLLASFVVSSVIATIWLYVLAMLIDLGLFGTWLVLAIRYSRRAASGELFDVPMVVRLTGASARKR